MVNKNCIILIAKKEREMNQEGSSGVYMTFINNVS